MILIVVSTGHFDPLIQECARLASKFEFFGQIGSGTFIPPFPYVRMCSPETIQKKMLEAELVISHGGAGMTAMLCRLQKKCIIIPKQKRYGEMNNLQVELAKKWGELGVGEFVLDVGDIEEAINRAKKKTYHYPKFPKLGAEIQRILGLEENLPMGFSKIPGYET